MPPFSKLVKCFTSKRIHGVCSPWTGASTSRQATRSYADTTKPVDGKAKTATNQIMVQGTENEGKLRVRRARPSDAPRVLRFVRDHAKVAWPGLVESSRPASSNVVLCDYVARALAQGHSMLAEQQESKRGWTQIRGLALGSILSPWDATILDKWARCLRCSRSRRLMSFTAHCLRAPGLHDKYRVHNIMQVILLVPPNNQKSTEIIQVLTKHAIQRGREVGLPLMRFDVTSDNVAKSLEKLKMTKEWQFSYNTLEKGTEQTERISENQSNSSQETPPLARGPDTNFLSVYTMFTRDTNT